MIEFIRKPVFFTCGWLSLILGVIGAFVPVLPTTPFVLLASYFFYHSSSVMHDWLAKHRVFGPLISDWEQFGVIRIPAKILATLLMTLGFSYLLFFRDFDLWLKVFLLCIKFSVLLFIWTRPGSKATSFNESPLRAEPVRLD